MMVWVYNVLLILLSVFLLPYYGVRMIRSDRYRHGFWQRIGFVPRVLRDLPEGDRRIWIHAVSVGETLAAVPLVKRLLREFPEYRLVFSTTTVTGQNTALERLPKTVPAFYFPLDFPWAVGNFLNRIRPELVLILETELWPNLFWEAERRDIPVVLVNGRISERSLHRYEKIRFFMRRVLPFGSRFLMQTQADADRIQFLGVPPGKVGVTGNIKFDGWDESIPENLDLEVRREFGIRNGERVLLAGSTHPGEEEMVLDSYRCLKDRFDPLRLILAPRRNERGPLVEQLVRERGFPVVLRSHIKAADVPAPSPGNPVIVLDTIGELKRLYGIADAVFVGGSLTFRGGHNILEPAMYKKCALFGPHMQNFKAIAEEFLSRRAGVEVRSGAELTSAIEDLLSDPQKAGEMGIRANRCLMENRGALDKTVFHVREMLGGREPGLREKR